MKPQEKAKDLFSYQTETYESIRGFRYGKIIRVDPEFQMAWIDYPDNPLLELLPARIGNPSIKWDMLEQASQTKNMVQLHFQEGDPSKPIITDLFLSTVEKEKTQQTQSHEKVLHVKADRIILEGTTEVIIKSGEVMSRYNAEKGQLIEEADSIRSTAKKRQRIQGGAVLIN